MFHSVESVFLNGVLIAIVAHGLIGLSLVWDKVLLQRKGTQNLLSYVFWLGAISIFGLILAFFGFRWPHWPLAVTGFVAGLLDLIASYFYYAALKSGEASEDLATMGGFVPVMTALFGIPFFGGSAVGGHLLAFSLLTAGGFVMFFAEKRPLNKMLPRILIASVAFGLSNVLQKVTFNGTGFVSGYVFFTLGTALGAFAMLIPPSWREQILTHSEQAPPRSKLWYGVNRFMAGVGSFLVVFAVSRANPAIVGSIAGVRYVIIFVGAYLITKFRPCWFKEHFDNRALTFKLIATGLVVAGLVFIGSGGGT